MKPLHVIYIAIACVICGMAVGASIVFVMIPTPNDSITPHQPPMTACTEEAKICPDGTVVVRVGPNCKFESCPSSTPTSTTSTDAPQDHVFCTQDVRECPDGSFVPRVPPTCEFAPCPNTK